MPNDIKWIKITTEMFDDEKIRIIEAMPEADTMIVLWIRLICMAGKTNDGGHVYITPEIPYSIEQLASVFGRPLNTVKLAIETFSRLGMVEKSDDGMIFLPAFERHQNIDALDKIRENNRRRQLNFRTRHNKNNLLISDTKTNETALRNVTVTGQIRVDKNILEKEKDEDKSFIDLNNYWLQVLQMLDSRVNKTVFNTWLKDSRPVVVNDGILYIEANSDQSAEYLRTNMKGLIENCLGLLATPPALKVDFLDPEY